MMFSRLFVSVDSQNPATVAQHRDSQTRQRWPAERRGESTLDIVEVVGCLEQSSSKT
jgi:hypothetical protein